MSTIKRVFVEKKPGFTIHADKLFNELQDQLAVTGLTGLRIIQRYDVDGLDDREFSEVSEAILSEPPLDIIYRDCPSAD